MKLATLPITCLFRLCKTGVFIGGRNFFPQRTFSFWSSIFNHQTASHNSLCISPVIYKYRHCVRNNSSAHKEGVYDEIFQGTEFEQFTHLICNEEIGKKIHLILLEYENYKEMGEKMPSQISEKDMKELLVLTSPGARRKYFNYIFKKEASQKAQLRKKEEKRLERLAKKEAEKQKALEDGSINHLQYGIGNCIFLFIRDQSMNKFFNYRQMYAYMFGQPIVFDFSFDNLMTKREIVNLADQFQDIWAVNKMSRDPYSVHICNAKPEQESTKRLRSAIPHLDTPSTMINISDKSYLDLFPRERLVYLTPDAREYLRNYDHDAIYIIGGMVDKAIQKPASLAKAKREGLKTAKLPLDLHLIWGSGASKSLPLNIVMSIMLEMKSTGDWKKALEFVPKRKLMREDSSPEPPSFARKKRSDFKAGLLFSE